MSDQTTAELVENFCGSEYYCDLVGPHRHVAIVDAVQVSRYVFDLGWNAAVQQAYRMVRIEAEQSKCGMTPKQLMVLSQRIRVLERDATRRSPPTTKGAP
jgi:hypothetical protein